jgi:two-component system NtrC family response regulator
MSVVNFSNGPSSADGRDGLQGSGRSTEGAPRVAAIEIGSGASPPGAPPGRVFPVLDGPAWARREIPLAIPARFIEGAVIRQRDRVFVLRRLSPDEQAALLAEGNAVPFGAVTTASPRLALLHRRLRRLARSGVELLLTGETGTGKEVYARAIHRESGRSGQLVAINCAAIPAELLESELFGYERGAHSTAVQSKRGLIEMAAEGTLFLDEIAEMPASLQAKLLRFLQDRQIMRLGTTEYRRIDVRIVAATNRALDGTAGPGHASSGAPGLRPDLRARFGPEAIELPPLRKRPEDIGALAHAFLDLHGGAGRWRFTPEAFMALCTHHWPFNVRELEGVVRWAVTLADGDVVDVKHLPASMVLRRGRGRPGKGPRPSWSDLSALLERHGGNVAQASRELGRCTATVWRWLNQLGIDVPSYRAQAGRSGRS